MIGDELRPVDRDRRPSSRQACRRAGLLRSGPARQRSLQSVPNYRVSPQGCSSDRPRFLPWNGHPVCRETFPCPAERASPWPRSRSISFSAATTEQHDLGERLVAARSGEHAPDDLSHGAHLLAIPTQVIVARITPPVPASFRIAADLAWIRQPQPGNGLRVQNDDVVGIRPRIVSGVSEEELVDLVHALLAAMECNVKAALCGRS